LWCGWELIQRLYFVHKNNNNLFSVDGFSYNFTLIKKEGLATPLIIIPTPHQDNYSTIALIPPSHQDI